MTEISFTNNTNRNFGIDIFYEDKDGIWKSALSYGVFGLDARAKNSVNVPGTPNYVLYYCEQNCVFPTESQVQAKYGKKSEDMYWGFCVAYDKKSGNYFVSQPFRYNINDAPVAGNEKTIIPLWQQHIIDVIAANPKLGITYDNYNFQFWLSWGYECFEGGGNLKMKTEELSTTQRNCFINKKQKLNRICYSVTDFKYE